MASWYLQTGKVQDLPRALRCQPKVGSLPVQQFALTAAYAQPAAAVLVYRQHIFPRNCAPVTGREVNGLVRTHFSFHGQRASHPCQH